MAKISKMALVSGAVELVASAGASVVVGNLVKATTPYDVGRFQKILVGIGGYAIGGVLSDLSAKYVHHQIDEYTEKFRSIFNQEPLTEEVIEEAIIVAEEQPKASRKRKAADTAEVIEEV